MKVFNKCLWHKWIKKSKYYDCSSICMWSSGTELYKLCEDCGKLLSKSDYESTYKEINKLSCIHNSILEDVYKKESK